MPYLKILTAITLLFLFGCSNNTNPETGSPSGGSEKTAAPNKNQSSNLTSPSKASYNYAHGKINQVLVVADSTLWKGMAGDTFFYYFTAPYILLPQPEPIFDVIHMTPEELADKSVRKEFRTIVFLANLNDESSVTTRIVRSDLGNEKIAEIKQGKGYNTTVGQDKWAKSQLLFYVSGFGEEKLVENITKNFPAIAKRINEKDAETVEATAYQAGRNADLEARVLDQYGIKMKIPGGFREARYDKGNNTLWLRSDDRDIIANILITKIPYTNKEQLTKEGLKSIRNKMGKLITTRQPYSYMRVNDVDLPLFVENKQLKNTYVVEARGIWDIVNDFMGGPFISRLLLNAETNELVMVDGFIYAPSKDKRNYMQEMESIVSTAQF